MCGRETLSGLPQIALNCLFPFKHSSAWLWSSVWSSVWFSSVFSTATDFHFQANFPRLQAINHTIVHLDSDSFDIPFEVIFELREEFLPHPELQLIA